MPKKTSPANLDPRVRRTRRLLREALVSLMLEKDYSSISIKEITNRAEVAYITFFRHFESLDQLLMEVLDEGLGELLARIETLAKQSDTSNLEMEGRLIFEYIGQKADLFRILFKSQSVTRVRKKVVQNIAAIFKKIVHTFGAIWQSHGNRYVVESHCDFPAGAHRVVVGQQNGSCAKSDGQGLQELDHRFNGGSGKFPVSEVVKIMRNQAISVLRIRRLVFR